MRESIFVVINFSLQPFLLSSRRDCRVQGSIQAEQISGLQSPYFALR
jgi:hypothetical protein